MSRGFVGAVVLVALAIAGHAAFPRYELHVVNDDLSPDSPWSAPGWC